MNAMHFMSLTQYYYQIQITDKVAFNPTNFDAGVIWRIHFSLPKTVDFFLRSFERSNRDL